MKKISLFFLLFNLLISSNSIAESLYDTDISVDVTAATVTEAKKKAMAKAQRDAVNEIVLNIGTESGVAEVNKLNDNQLQHFISGVMVLMEKSSDVRYIADLRITVNGDILKAYMIENELPIVAVEEYDVLVIPLLETSDGQQDLWSDKNVWRDAFLQRPNLQKGNLHLQLIDKNLGNITVVPANRIYDMTMPEYAELAAFNKIDDIYVVKYSLKNNKVYVKAFPRQDEAVIDLPEDNPHKVIDLVLPYFKDIRKTEILTQSDSTEEKIEAVYSYPQLGNWMKLKNLLEKNSQIRDLTVISMVNGKVHFNFIYTGAVEKLFSNLETIGYQFKNEGDYYAVY